MKRLYALIVAAALCFPSIGAGAWWQSIQQVSVSGGAVTPATFGNGFSDSQAIAFASSTYTSPSKTFATGVAIIFINGNGGRVPSITGATIKGFTATPLVAASNSGQAVFYASVTAGTGTVVVTNSTTWADVVMNGGTITTASSSPSAASVLTNSAQADPQLCGAGITVPANGVGIAGASQTDVNTGTPVTWNANGGVAIAGVSGMAVSGPSEAADGGSTSTAGTLSPTISSGSGLWAFHVPTCSLVAWGP